MNQRLCGISVVSLELECLIKLLTVIVAAWEIPDLTRHVFQ